MKRTLLGLLTLAICLSACTPAAPETETEAPVTATAETAPGTETASTAKTETPAAGGIRGDNGLQQDGALRYSIGNADPSEGENRFRLLVLDCETGRQSCLYTLDEPAQTVSDPFAVNGMVYVFADQTMYQIPADGGEARKMTLPAPFYPTSMDEAAGYSFAFDTGVNNFCCTRLDLQTGELSQVKLPAQTNRVWAVNQPRVFLCRLVTDAPLPSVDEGELYGAAIQNAVCEYGWYDLTDGTFQKVAEEPYYGVEQPDGTKRRREFEGMADGRLYFVWRVLDGESVTQRAGIESCAPDGTDWQPVTDLPQGGDAVWTLEEKDELRWIISDSGGRWVYDVADGQAYAVETLPMSDGWVYGLTDNDRVLLGLDPVRYGDRYPGGFAMADRKAFLEGSTDWMPLELYGAQRGIGKI